MRYIDGPLTYTGTASGDVPFSTTIPASSGASGHGTVLLFTPISEALVPIQTRTVAYTGPSTITAPLTTAFAPADGGPPTVLVQTPNDFPAGPLASVQVTFMRQYIGTDPADETIMMVGGKTFACSLPMVSGNFGSRMGTKRVRRQVLSELTNVSLSEYCLCLASKTSLTLADVRKPSASAGSGRKLRQSGDSRYSGSVFVSNMKLRGGGRLEQSRQLDLQEKAFPGLLVCTLSYSITPIRTRVKAS